MLMFGLSTSILYSVVRVMMDRAGDNYQNGPAPPGRADTSRG